MLQGYDLLLSEGAQEHLLLVPGPGSLPVEDGHPPAHANGDLSGNALILVADDIGHLGGVQTVQHHVGEVGGYEHGHCAIQGSFDVPEGRAHGGHHDQVQDQQYLAQGQPGQLQLHQPGGQVGAPGGGPLGKDDAQGQTDGHAAEHRRQHGVPQGLEHVDGVEQIQPHRGQGHGEQRGQQQVSPKVLPPQEKQGQVHHKGERSDGQGGHGGIDDLGHAGQPAVADVVGHIQPVKADAVQHRGQHDQTVLPQKELLSGSHW